MTIKGEYSKVKEIVKALCTEITLTHVGNEYLVQFIIKKRLFHD